MWVDQLTTGSGQAPGDISEKLEPQGKAAVKPALSAADEGLELCCGVAINQDAQYDAQYDAPDTVCRYLPDDSLIYRATEIFAALADSTRFKILSALANGELCVHELVAVCDVSQSAVSHQLRLLKDRSLVNSRREGKKVVYSFADDHVRSLILVGLEHAAESEGQK